MGSAKGYYSLVQYCPDPSRAEAATIGVALFCPEIGFADARISDSDARIKKFFGSGGLDRSRLKMQKDSIRARVSKQAKRIARLEDLSPFIATFANELTLTMPRPMRVVDPERDLCELYQQLVGDGRDRVRSPYRIPQLDNALRAPNFARKIRRNYPVMDPIFGTPIRIPYAYQNGHLNPIKPEQFPENTRKAADKARQLALEGDLLFRYPEEQKGSRQLVVVAALQEGASDDLAAHISQVLSSYHTRPVFESDIPKLLTEIEEQGRPFVDDAGTLDDA